MKMQLLLFFFTTSFLMSCGQTLKLSEEDFKWMPYKGDETLVFKSSTGETDTIFILKKDTILAYPEAQAVNGITYEVVSVFCNNSGRNKQNSDRSYYLFKVQKAKDSHTELVFDLSVKGAKFYSLTPVKIDSLSKINPTSLQTSYRQYDDVYVIHPDSYAKDFYDRSNFVTKIYWSKSYGLIRFDKKDSIYWELEKKN